MKLQKKGEINMYFKVESKFKASVLFEASIAVEGVTYLIIYGKHINGYFCSLPGRKWGCEMADPEEVAYNRDKLMDCGASEKVAHALAEAIRFVMQNSVLMEQPNKDKLILEYTSLCLEFSNFAGPDPVDAEREERIINRLYEIRKLLGMEPIVLKVK
jgi:hypothetical protein